MVSRKKRSGIRSKGPDPKGRSRRRSPYLSLLLGCLLLGGCLRIIYLWQFSANTPFFDAPIVDAEMYDQRAQEIASGEWIGHQIDYQSPLYAYMLGVLYTIGGHSYLLVYVVQALLGLVGLFLIFLLGKTVFNETVAIIAVMMALLYGPFVFYESKLLMTTVATCLNLCLLLWLLRALHSPSTLKWLLGGLLLGVTVLIRGNMLFFLPFVLIWLYLIGGKSRPTFTRRAGAVLVGTMIAIAPVTLRNYFVGKDFVPIAAHTGITFFMGNNPEATGTYTKVAGLSGIIRHQQEEERRMAEEALGRKLKPSEISAYWYKRGIRFILSQPLQYLRLELKKVLLLLNTLELANNYNFDLERRLVPVLWLMPLPYALISSLALIGIVWGIRHNKGTMLLALFAAAYGISLLVFFVLSRYRIPVVPVLILFASYAGYVMVRAIRKRHLKKVVVGSVALILLLILTTYPFQEKKEMLGEAYATVGNVYAEKRMYQPALRSYHQALQLNPSLATAYNNMGNVYFTLNQLDQAEAAYTKAIELDSSHHKAYYNLSMISKTRGSFQRVIDILEQATAIHPTYAAAHYELGNAHRQLKHYDEAIEAYQRTIELQPRFAEAYNNLGIVYLNTGRREEALRAWRSVLQVNPNSEAARMARDNIRALEETASTPIQEKEEETK
jgi:tetratricopeptide (TPR) repeat protein